MHTDFAHSAATANTQPPAMPPPHASTSHSGATPTGFARSTNRLGREDTDPTSATLLEVAQSDQIHLRQALLALETLESDALLLPSPDLDQVQVANINDAQTIEVTNIVRRLLSVQRIFGGQGTVMLIRSSTTNTGEYGDEVAPVDAIAYCGGEPGGLNRILLYSLSARQWLVQHLSIYVLQRLHSHFQYGIVFETPALRFPLKPLNDEFTTETRPRIAKKWTSSRLGDRLLAIEKLGHLMPELYFDVVNQFLRGKAVGSVDSAFGFAIVIPSISFAQEKLVHLPYFRERRSYR